MEVINYLGYYSADKFNLIYFNEAFFEGAYSFIKVEIE